MNTWQLTQQAATVAKADHSGIEWTGAELNTMAALKAQGASVTQIASALQRSYYAVSTKLQLAGLSKARRSSTETQINACADCWMVHAGECI